VTREIELGDVVRGGFERLLNDPANIKILWIRSKVPALLQAAAGAPPVVSLPVANLEGRPEGLYCR
jgi:hypothetical protein